MQTQLFINGAYVDAASGETFDVLAPATEQVLARVARAGAEDVGVAVAAARTGAKAWQALTPAAREACLLKAADLVAAQGMERLLDILIDESGSVINKARMEVRYTVDLLRTAAGEARRLYGETFPNDNPSRISMVMREPLGVVAVISPYNAPLSLLTKMLAFPLAAGNAIVVKPSEETPLIALALAEILHEAGFPDGVVNVITGFGAECGAPLTNHPGINCIALTGSTTTGKLVGAQAMQRMLKTQLELGGKSAVLILADADPVKAANIVAQGIFTHSGQICMANSRAIVERSIYPELVDAIIAICRAMPIGPLRDESSVYGPLINRKAVEKVQAIVDDAVSKGATLLYGGKVRDGLVYEPTILANVPHSCLAWREELFGPVLCISAADGIEDAVSQANDADYGLSSAVLTRDIAKAMYAAKHLEAGAVHIGMHAFQSNALAPIGGSKLSGIGRSGGAYSTEEFTEVKWISMELNPDV